MNVSQSNTFGTGYNTCRDAYFTCMDQFCATANDQYRRCICSSKLDEIKSRERALNQTSNQLSDFKTLNMSVIDKSPAEVKAMLSASSGEHAQETNRDTSNSAKQLSGISAVLSKTKNQSLSTQGTLDIAGDINAIWSTTGLTGGSNISNLTGEPLYNAVHAQCAEMVADKCPSTAIQTMVVTAYGMYIENDCSLLINNLDSKLINANSTIRSTEREMNLARLENYNNHNATSINDCIAMIRSDITADTACGPDYIHCLDLTGLYLNYETGEPIYSPRFYQLETQISLSGDLLKNQTNRLLVAELNRKRPFAANSLDTCRDLSDDIWQEFMRQAITEIYQGQQQRIRQVKNECLDVVINCYQTQEESLKDFSNVKEQLLLGSRLELSEQMCKEKLDACSNLYGGGARGMKELIIAMRDIVDQKIAANCLPTLQDYAKNLCITPSNDTIHSYPYACRVYAPGDQTYAKETKCNITTTGTNTAPKNPEKNTGQKPNQAPVQGQGRYNCSQKTRFYFSCKPGYHFNSITKKCLECPAGYICTGGKNPPIPEETETKTEPIMYIDGSDCGTDYIGSLYHKLVRYAMQACVRPSFEFYDETPMPSHILQDVNIVMDKIRIDMANSLSAECNRLGGVWVDTVWIDNPGKDGTEPDKKHDVTQQELFERFYSETSANTKWGFCTPPPEETEEGSENPGGDTTE